MVWAVAFWAGPVTALGIWGWWRADQHGPAIATGILGVAALLIWWADERSSKREAARHAILWACPDCGEVCSGPSRLGAQRAVVAHKDARHGPRG